MDMLPAAADALPRRPTAAEYPVRTVGNEGAYYAQHTTLNFTVPAWVPAVSALLRSFRAVPGPFGAPCHA
jgi:hypothetical protein